MWAVIGSVLLGFTMGIVSTNTSHSGTALGLLTVLVGTGGLAALDGAGGERAGQLLSGALAGFLVGLVGGAYLYGKLKLSYLDQLSRSIEQPGDPEPEPDQNETPTERDRQTEVRRDGRQYLPLPAVPLEPAATWSQRRFDSLSNALVAATVPLWETEKPGAISSGLVWVPEESETDHWDSVHENDEFLSAIDDRIETLVSEQSRALAAASDTLQRSTLSETEVRIADEIPDVAGGRRDSRTRRRESGDRPRGVGRLHRGRGHRCADTTAVGVPVHRTLHRGERPRRTGRGLQPPDARTD
jgi:hypothetical protein